MAEVSLPSTSRRFRFRDHPNSGDHVSNREIIGSNNITTSTSISDGYDNEPEVQSMAGKGIMHLCSELLELKRVSDEDFHHNLFSNYSAFVSIFREVKGLQRELIHLKKHVSTQKLLVKGLADGINIDILSNDWDEYTIDDDTCLEPSSQSLYKTRADNVLEVLDVLLSERRLDEALEVLESEDAILEDVQSQENLPPDEIQYYSSLLLEKRARIVDQLKLVAENPRVSPAELLKDLRRLHRAGDSHLATHILLQYYRSRIVSGECDLQFVKFPNGPHIYGAAKHAFSMIYQATKSFLALNGEGSSHFLDLVQWAYEETEVFASFFNEYVQSISDINGGMVTVLEGLQSALSYCSLLETEGLVLNPCLVKHIRPCLEEFLQTHIDHFKKVIGIFTSSDAWVGGRYLLYGILGEECSSVDSEEQTEYCSLTSSGWKLVMVLQAITGYVVPLLTVQLEGHILKALLDIYTEYVYFLDCALSLNNLDEDGPRINLAETPEQQVSLLANISSLALLLSSIIRSTFNNSPQLTSEADNVIRYIRESPDQLRGQLCEKFISKVMDGSGSRVIPETWVSGESRFDQLDDMMPSLVFQGLFFELRKLEKLAEDDIAEVDWLLELMRELMTAVFISILNDEELWKCTTEELSVEHSGNLKQFILDMQFLVEIAKHGGYFCDDIMRASLSVLSHMEAAFICAGLEPERAGIDEEWAIKAANEALQKLQEMAGTESPPNESVDNPDGEIRYSNSAYASDALLNSDVSQQGTVSVANESFDEDSGTANSGDSISNSRDMEEESGFNMTNTAEKIEHMKSLKEQLCLNGDEESFLEWSEDDETKREYEASDLVIIKEEEGVKTKSVETSFQGKRSSF